MFKVIFFCFHIACYFVYVACIGTITHGEWRVLDVGKCPDDEKYRVGVDMRRRPVNETTDIFDLVIHLNETVDRSYGMWIDVCVHMEGTCKPYLVLADVSMELFMKRYAKDYLERVLVDFGLVPPDFPVKPGNYKCVDYLFDYQDLPNTGVAGDFGATAYLMKRMKKIACLTLTLHFTTAQ